jgi:hypothetical protein
MRILNRHGELDERIATDPRWSQGQREAAVKAAGADPAAAVVGLDAKMRPVFLAKLSGPARRTTYAVLRNGAPTKAAMPLEERWSGQPNR